MCLGKVTYITHTPTMTAAVVPRGTGPPCPPPPLPPPHTTISQHAARQAYVVKLEKHISITIN